MFGQDHTIVKRITVSTKQIFIVRKNMFYYTLLFKIIINAIVIKLIVKYIMFRLDQINFKLLVACLKKCFTW